MSSPIVSTFLSQNPSRIVDISQNELEEIEEDLSTLDLSVPHISREQITELIGIKTKELGSL